MSMSKAFEEGQSTDSKPDFITEEHLFFLDDLRKSGKTNMFGARPYIQRKFKMLTPEQATTLLSYWMNTFSKRHPR